VLRLVSATPEQMEAVYRESHAIWGSGLSFEEYLAYWRDLMATPWARRRFHFEVWLGEDGRVLSSLKVYRLEVDLLGRRGGAAGIGAVFTPQAERGRGHAAAMLRAVVEAARRRGDLAAFLFSDIGTRYYEALGFQALPAEETRATLRRASKRAPAGWRLRAFRPDDLDAVMEVQADARCGAQFAVVRDRAYWEFLLERARGFFQRHDGSGLERRYRVAERDGRFAGYLFASEAGGVWTIREAGAPGNDPEAIASILRAGAAEARADGARDVEAWLDPAVAERLPEWCPVPRPRDRAIPMAFALEEGLNLAALKRPGGSVYLPYLDQF
jgi:GNAT superfamily N-acetyltransferase